MKQRKRHGCYFTARYPHRSAYSHSWSGVFLAWRLYNPAPIRTAQREAWRACYPDAQKELT